ncbi:F-box/LRR-repeat protein At3g26922-like isoform X1 [Tripterygium wilfordii]|uniref:F-box/LRR-repeat protein At3g26922-like isoform X1 n=1 Tax=Tripterygium wilfordii TaxID=458696 RepID=UPI0018F7EB92|nr:F-box/LRR-repeat protein At3g26922-like isoform X1 [Tripterygium wilfordii]XP_038690400.1 F-box/LRR-repeat protein At3g26922-like isoform X1 [Tripterygium wilfordii]
MDAISESKKQKPSEVQGMNQAGKRLSDLPDVVLLHVLSYLPTKDAVRTRSLSKRWECLWASIPMLKFSENEANRIHLMDIVDDLLSLGSSDIEKLDIVWVLLGDAVRIRRSISTAVWCNVLEFHICQSDCKRLFETPDSPFTYQSFRELELLISHTRKIPPPICLSTLKILNFENITFTNDHSTQLLFSGCPELEEVILSKCNWVNVNVVSICAPKLWSLKISDMEIDNHQWNESDGCDIVIFGTSLKFFKYSGEFLNDYFLYDSSSIDEVRIEMDNARERSRVAAYRLYNLLRGISDVKKLVLSADAIEVLNHASELLTQMPLFNNLRTLTLNSEPLDLESKALLMIIANSPILKALEFSEMRYMLKWTMWVKGQE